MDVQGACTPYARRRVSLDVHVNEPTAAHPHGRRNRRSPDHRGAATPPHHPDREDDNTESPSPESPNPTLI